MSGPSHTSHQAPTTDRRAAAWRSIGPVRKTFRYEPLHLIGDGGWLAVLGLVLLLFVKMGEADRAAGHGGGPSAAAGWAIFLTVAVLGCARWLIKPYAVDLARCGFVLRSLCWTRFVPWTAIRSGEVGEMPMAHDVVDDPLIHADGMGGEMPAARLSLRTTRGRVVIGPDLQHHVELIDAIRRHMV